MPKYVILGALSALCLLASPALAAPTSGGDTAPSETYSTNFSAVSSLPGLSRSELGDHVAQFQASLRGEVPHLGRGGLVTQSRHVESNPSTGTKQQISRVDLKSAVSLVAVQWPADGPQPLALLGRYLQGGAWSTWQTIGDDFESSRDGSIAASEPWIVSNAAKAEVAVVLPKSAVGFQPKVEVIDPGTRQADQNYALNDQGHTHAFVSAKTPTLVTPGQASGPDGGDPNATKDNQDDAGNKVIPPSNVENEWTKVPATGQPSTLYTRADWGANESWRSWRAYRGEVTGAVVHHTATANDYSPEAVPSILRSIYRYHAISLKWGDIGYNVLVDNFGRAWQGRAGDFWHYNTVGAHASGVNSWTFGISVLGNYTDFRPSDAAVDTVSRVIAYKLKPTGLDPLELQTTIHKGKGTITAPVISGHRDVGATACPGNAFYAFLPTLRQMVAEYISQPSDPIKVPDYAQLQQNQINAGVPLALAGADRVGTSIEIARHAFPQGSRTVYLANAVNTADALAGGSLTDGPIVLVSAKRDAQAAVANYVREAKATKVVALGGPGAVSNAALNAAAGGVATERIGGRDRVETSALIARHAAGTRPASAVFLAEMSQGIDALAAGSLTAGPVILVPTNGKLPSVVTQTIAAINPAKVVALGGPGAVSNRILSQASAGRASERIFGADRYETAREISKYQFPQGSAQVYLASGKNPVDAVAGGVLTDGPILLLPNARGKSLNGSIAAEIVRLQAHTATALGGPGAVAQEQINQVFVTLQSIGATPTPRAK